jgi:hypothetical protein
VLGGQYQNKHLFDRLNLQNASDQAVQIARGTLSAICRAVGVMTPKDSSELHNKPLRVKVTVKKSDDYGEQNEVKAYKPRLITDNAVPPLQRSESQLGSSVPPPAASSSDAAPWA